MLPGLASPEGIALPPPDELPLLRGLGAQRKTLESKGSIEKGRLERWIAMDGTVGGSEGEEDLIRIGGRRAPLKTGCGKIAPHHGIRWLELRSVREAGDRRVGIAAEKLDDCALSQGLGGGPFSQGAAGSAVRLPEDFREVLAPTCGFPPGRADETCLPGPSGSQRRGDRIAILPGSPPATPGDDEAESETEETQRPRAGKPARRPSMKTLQDGAVPGPPKHSRPKLKGEPMSSIALRIVLHGLIALVPTTDPNGVNHMTALLVNGLEDHGIDERCPSTHHPMLRFLVVETGECDAANCEFSGNQCTCREAALTGKHISLDIRPVTTSASQRLTSSPPINRLPTSKSEAASFSYVANLAQAPFGLSLNQEYLGTAPPEHLLARMKFPFNSITSCTLAAREDGGDAYVHEMSFRKLHDPSLKTDISQALAQRVITEISIPDGNGSEEQQVILRISNFGDPETAGHKIRLLPGASGYRIEISNQPPKPLDRDDPCNDGVARHFAMFYELADGSIPLSQRLLPHVRFAPSMNGESIRPEICNEPVFALMDRPICPMVTFNP